MTYRSIFRHVAHLAVGGFRYSRRLASGDSKAWQYLPYQLSMLSRGIDLSGLSVEDIGLPEEHLYRDSGGPDLDKLLTTLSISRSDIVVDIGCGKAGAMLTLAKYPFARVDGVELSPQLAQVGQNNLRRLRLSKARIVCCDAAEFTDLECYTYFYMYNPFTELVMCSVMNNIVSSVNRHRRKITMIYKNPVFHDLVVSAGFRKIAETRQVFHPFSIYVWDPVANAASQECRVRG